MQWEKHRIISDILAKNAKPELNHEETPVKPKLTMADSIVDLNS
jgi:hypothetical protein